MYDVCTHILHNHVLCSLSLWPNLWVNIMHCCPSIQALNNRMEEHGNFKFGGNIFPYICNFQPILGHRG